MRWRLMLGGWRTNVAAVLVAGGAYLLIDVPAALAFPYVATIGATTVYSDVPIDRRLPQVLARADALLATSPIDQPGIRRRIVLTDGGWRWQVMAAGYGRTVALRRPYSSTLLFNRSDVARDRIASGAVPGRERTLSGTIAHETVHLLTAKRIGEWRLARLPVWKREGYADFVAGETSVGGDADEARVRATDPGSPVLIYYEGRRRVAAALARNGGDVDALFAE